MDDARSRYFFTNAWRSMASTRNLFGKLCLLALVQFVPVLGQIVTLGYFLGWAREAAWKMETPLPAHVFGRGDDTFWARGALGFVVCLLYGIIDIVMAGLLSAGYGAVVGSFDLSDGAFAAVSAVYAVLLVVVLLLLCAFQVVGLVRMAIYTSFGAAFQWGVACRMIGHRFGGLFKLFWTSVLTFAILGVLSCVVVASLVPAAVGVGVGVSLAAAVVSSGELTQATGALLGSVLGAGAFATVAFVAVSFFVTAASLLVEGLLWRALGSWVAQFDVAAWGGRRDKLPYQTAAASTPQPAETPDLQPADASASADEQVPDAASVALATARPEPERRSHPALVGLGSLGIALLVGLACSGCTVGLAVSLYNSGAVQIDVDEVIDAFQDAADDMAREWEDAWDWDR